MRLPAGDAALRRAEWAGVAAASGAAAFLILQAWPGSPPASAAAPLLLGLLLWIAAVDLRRWIIPDGAVAAVAILGLGWRLAVAGETGGVPGEAVLAAAEGLLWGGAFLLVREIHFRRRGFDGLGLGDVKLALACGVLNGTTGFAWALLLASFGGLAVALAVSMRGGRLDRVPFGAFLAPASGLVWFAGWSG